MDTSETYIHQCDCVEVQQSCKVQSGDYFFCCCRDIEGYPDGYGVNVITSNDADHGNLDLIFSKTDIWLPRQDQIQEMMGRSCINRLINALKHWMKVRDGWFDCNDKRWFGISSMEQLWLACYMYWEHNKYWNREIWVDLEGK